jgi:hypothetical protein
MAPDTHALERPGEAQQRPDCRHSVRARPERSRDVRIAQGLRRSIREDARTVWDKLGVDDVPEDGAVAVDLPVSDREGAAAAAVDPHLGVVLSVIRLRREREREARGVRCGVLVVECVANEARRQQTQLIRARHTPTSVGLPFRPFLSINSFEV